MKRQTRPASRTRSVITTAVFLALAVCAYLFNDYLGSLPEGGVADAPPTSGAKPGELAALAASLPVIDEAVSIPRYDRASFGPRWSDIDANGCDQRQDVLARDLDAITVDGCTVLTGTLDDPYTGTLIKFQHDRVADAGNLGSQAVQIDHIVSLAAAHRGGAWQWSPEQRETFANSPEVLLAVDGPANNGKQDKGPSEWLPEYGGYVCEYSQRYTEIVLHWRLAVLEADRDVLVSTLSSCGL